MYDNTHSRGIGLSARHTVGPGQNSFYNWDHSLGAWTTLYGRVYVWFDALPAGDLRLIRGKTNSALSFAIDVLRTGKLRVRDRSNKMIAQTSTTILTRGWVRVEWRVDIASGQIDLRVYNSPNSTTPTDSVTTGPGQAIGPNSSAVQIGRSGTQAFSAVFWTDDPVLSGSGYLGPIL